MRKRSEKTIGLVLVLIAIFLLFGAGAAQAVFIPGISGPTFQLTAKTGIISPDDGNAIFMWGFANGTNLTSGPMQYPGPTLIVNQGDTVTLTLYNQLSGLSAVNTSIVFPGQSNVTATVGDPGVPGLLTNEAIPGGTVTYTFVASEPGTYSYYSGTRTDLQVEMGLFGALIVRPTLGNNFAYNHADTLFDHEYLFVLSEIDPVIHGQVQFGQMANVNNTTAFPVYWFINGRTGFDTIAGSFIPILPSQPYGSLVRAHPNEKVLARMIGAGRDLHPFHLHGNHHHLIARDGRLIESTPGAGPDVGEFVFTTAVGPGQTFDALFTWTGEGLGWDFYGHTSPPSAPGAVGQACVDAGVPLAPNEPLADHCRPVPVTLPIVLDSTAGPVYSGSPFLGTGGFLPPGEGGFNPNSGFAFMWHSHSEKELTSNNIFPGGMMTFCIIEAPGVPIP
jgi:manganese oxidase